MNRLLCPMKRQLKRFFCQVKRLFCQVKRLSSQPSGFSNMFYIPFLLRAPLGSLPASQRPSTQPS